MEKFKTLIDEHNRLWQQLKIEKTIDKFYDRNVTALIMKIKFSGSDGNC